ncbi:hypothetical protein O181_022590 [Austropuccinia psidii MF-1]|uniref:Uncharacterized protein n=1 Tax=Austropuccinia psidii MF-1 TaxID=1389203 RepID=A0A9Q3GY84_9BASI|nr:hypothetical protein [Austropuccinia psidii MF-1]
MTPSSNHCRFSLTAFLRGNTGNSFSRDIKEVAPKQSVKFQWSINPPWQPHSFNKVWIHQDLYFKHTPWEDHSFNPVHFSIWQGIHSIRQSIQLPVFNTDQLPA